MENYFNSIEKKLREKISFEKLEIIDNSEKHKDHKFFSKDRYTAFRSKFYVKRRPKQWYATFCHSRKQFGMGQNVDVNRILHGVVSCMTICEVETGFVKKVSRDVFWKFG